MKKKINKNNIGDKYLIPKIYFTVYKKDGRTKYYKNSSKQRIASLIASTKLKDSIKKARLKVIYGKAMGVFGKMEVFDNEIEGDISDIKWGLHAFMDNDLFIRKTKGR